MDMESITTATRESQLELVTPQNEARILHAKQNHTLNLFALSLLRAGGNDRARAETLLDDVIDLLLEGGILSTWRYRLVLAEIRGYAQ